MTMIHPLKTRWRTLLFLTQFTWHHHQKNLWCTIWWAMSLCVIQWSAHFRRRGVYCPPMVSMAQLPRAWRACKGSIAVFLLSCHQTFPPPMSLLSVSTLYSIRSILLLISFKSEWLRDRDFIGFLPQKVYSTKGVHHKKEHKSDMQKKTNNTLKESKGNAPKMHQQSTVDRLLSLYPALVQPQII